MKRITIYMLLAAAIALCGADASAASPDEYRKTEHRVAMRDGRRLYVAVYAPAVMGEKAPVLLMRTPYGCQPYGEEMSGFLNSQIYKPYVDAGYIFAFQDVRGRWMSEGDGENVRPLSLSPGGTDDATDAYDTIEWLVDSVPGNNGRVGVYGGSYCGYYSLSAAAGRHPALRAVSPQAPVGDWFMGDDMHHNGAFALMDAIAFAPHLVTEKNHKATPSQQFMEGVVSGDVRRYYLSHTLADIAGGLGGRVAFLDSVFSHPDYDRFWQERTAEQFTRGITAPMLIVGGFFDAEDLYGTLAARRWLKANSPGLSVTLAMGPWAHGQWRDDGAANALGSARFGDGNLALYYRDNIEFPFFDYYLRDKGARPTDDHIFFTGENRWFTGDADSLPGEALDVYLSADSTLSFSAPTVGVASRTYISDPANPVPFFPGDNRWRDPAYMTAGQQFVEERDDVLTYTGPVLTDTLRVAGDVGVQLYVSLTSTDADFVVKVIDEAPDGSQMLVRGDIFRGRYRNGFDRPEPFVPGRIENVDFVMNAVAHTFLPGHRMKVQVQSSWFPLFDMNPQQFVDIYRATRADFIPATVTVISDTSHPSHIHFRRAKLP